MNAHVASLLAACCATATVACGLAEPSGFGEPCETDRGCARGLVCVGARTDSKCLPAPPALPPDTRGRACDEPASLSFNDVAGRLIGSGDYTLTPHNTAVRAPHAASGIESPEVRAFHIALDLASDADMVLRVTIAAPFKAALVWVAGVDDSLDADCDTADRYDVAPARSIGAEELVLTRVAPGRHALVVLADVAEVDDIPFSVSVEQVRCPPGFLPDGDGCVGFVVLDDASPRIEHSVDFMGDGRAVAIGGFADEEGVALNTAEIWDPHFSSLLVQRTFFQRAQHGSTTIEDGSVVVVGGTEQEGNTGSALAAFRPGEQLPYELLDLFPPEIAYATECLVTPLKFPEVALAACRGHRPWIFSAAFGVAGSACDDSYECGDGFRCVAEVTSSGLDDDGTCVCAEERCSDPLLVADWLELVAPDDIPDHGHYLVSLAAGGFGGDAVFVAGGSTKSGAPATPYVIINEQAGFFRAEPEVVASLIPRAYAQAVVLKNKVLVAGGASLDDERTPIGGVEMFDPRIDERVKVVSLATPRVDSTLVVLDDHRAMIIGGRDAGDGALATTEVIDIDTRRASRGPTLPFAVYRHASGFDRAGQVIVAGGIGADGALVTRWSLLTRIDATFTAPPPVATHRAGDRCDTAIPLVGESGVEEGDTQHMGNDVDIQLDLTSDCGGAFQSPGPDVFYRVDVPANRGLVVTLMTSQPVDICLYALSSCPLRGDSCVAGADELGVVTAGTSAEDIVVAATATARTLYLGADNAGTYLDDGGLRTSPFDFALHWELFDP